MQVVNKLHLVSKETWKEPQDLMNKAVSFMFIWCPYIKNYIALTTAYLHLPL